MRRTFRGTPHGDVVRVSRNTICTETENEIRLYFFRECQCFPEKHFRMKAEFSVGHAQHIHLRNPKKPRSGQKFSFTDSLQLRIAYGTREMRLSLFAKRGARYERLPAALTILVHRPRRGKTFVIGMGNTDQKPLP